MQSDYLFHFDRSIEPTVFGGSLEITGWLLPPAGRQIHGLRVLVRRKFSRSETFRARRKRNRADVAAAHPERTDALASGFMIELRLRLGCNHLTFQVLDHARRWQTLSSASVTAFPFSTLEKTGFTRSRELLISSLQKRSDLKTRRTLSPPVRATSIERPNRIELFATSRSNLFMVEIGELIAAGFRDVGYEAQLHLDCVPSKQPPPGTMQMVVAPHEYHSLFLVPSVGREQALALTSQVHLLCTEQPETGWFHSGLEWARHSLGVADIHPLGVAAYHAQGIPARQLALGYHPLLAHSQCTAQSQRKVDVIFLGSLTKRRESFLAQHADFFANHACHLRLVPLEFAKTPQSVSYLQSGRRNELLSQSHILLNLHHGEQKYFEWHRMLAGLANGCCIITETCQGYGPLLPNEHFIMVEREDLIAACEYFLAHPVERERIAEAGRQFVQTKLAQARMCEDFLRKITEAQPEPWAIDQPSMPLPASLRTEISKRTRAAFKRAVARDIRGIFGQREPRREVELQTDPLSRDAILERREAYRARFEAQEKARLGGKPIFEIHDNAAPTTAAGPALSILVTLFNYGRHIDECLERVSSAAEVLAEPIEIVIVNDSSTDDSLSRALRFQKNSKLHVRVVDKMFNTGLADARNIGIQLASAPLIFMMDADNLVFPGAFRQLLDAIGRQDAAAAYSLLCRFRGTTSERVGLLSAFDWDPQILVQYPYIDAMALFRRDALLEIGAYDNDLNQVGWFGLEDYDLWLRFAQAHYPVAFVPNTLCLYRDHQTSMIQTTKLFASEMVGHFIQRYGAMLKDFEPREMVFGGQRKDFSNLLPPVAKADTVVKLPTA